MARPIADYFPGVLNRAAQMAKFQGLINDISSASRRKEMIMTARMGDLITDEECQLLIQAYGLETA